MASKKAATITVEIKSWASGAVLFAAAIAADTPPHLHVREAVVAAVKARANLTRANLAGAYLAEAKNFDRAICRYQIPQEGELIVWKKVRGGLCKLRVPPEAKRTGTPISRKCRAEWVEVLEAPEAGRSKHDERIVYRAGETVRPGGYNGDPRLECTNGIHFFLTREEAEEY